MITVVWWVPLWAVYVVGTIWFAIEAQYEVGSNWWVILAVILWPVAIPALWLIRSIRKATR